MSITIETYRLILKQFSVADANEVSYNSKRPIVSHYLSDMVLETKQTAIDWINWINNDKFNISVPNVVLAVVLKETNACVGLVGIAPKYELDNQIEILFGIVDEYQNHGYITEAGHALINWAFVNTPLEVLVAIAQHDNLPSNHVIKNLKFAYCGEKRIDHNGEMTDFHYYRLEKSTPLEPMNDFFTARADGYDTHMLTNVEGCKEGYIKMAEIVAEHYREGSNLNLPLLDLGCGTGLELEEIFKRIPSLAVTGVDLTKAMLDRLQEKFSDKALNLICGSYFDVDFGVGSYGCAISFQTMHHFTHEKKTALYKRIYKALDKGEIYLECDYMVEHQADEDFYFAENTRLRNEQKLSPDGFFHYDTPCTIENQIAMLKAAGFSRVEQVFRLENTTMLVARK